MFVFHDYLLYFNFKLYLEHRWYQELPDLKLNYEKLVTIKCVNRLF